MIDPSDAKDIKQDYLAVLEALFNKIKLKAKQQGLAPNDKDSMSIFFGSRKVYEQSTGEKPSINKINSKQVEALNKAISEPETLKGSISIKINQQKVFHAKDGKVIVDKLDLTNLQNQSQKNTSDERTYSVEALQKQVEVLQNRVEQQQKLVESLKQQPQTQETFIKLATQVEDLFKSLEKQQKLIEKTQLGLQQINERQNATPVNSKLQNWVGAIETKVKQVSKSAFEQVKSVVNPEIVKLRSQISKQAEELKKQIEQQITNIRDDLSKKLDNVMLAADTKINSTLYDVNQKIENVRSTLDTNVRATKGKAIEAGVTAMLHLFGDRHKDGFVTFESKNFNFEQSGDKVTVKAKDGREVLKNGILTLDALESEVEALEQVQSGVDEYLGNSQTESQSRALKR